MKSIHVKFFAFFFLMAYLLSACGQAAATPAPAQPTDSGKTAPVEFAGTVEKISADAWMVSGQDVQVDASTQVNGAFSVGDQVQVSALVQPDGRVMAKEISPYQQVSAADLTEIALSATPTLEPFTPTPAATEVVTIQETVGVVASIVGDVWTVNDQTFTVDAQTEIAPGLAVGMLVTVHWYSQADGSLKVTEISPVAATPTQVASGTTGGSGSQGAGTGVGNGNGSDDGGGSGEDSGDDNGNDGGGEDEGGEDGGDD